MGNTAISACRSARVSASSSSFTVSRAGKRRDSVMSRAMMRRMMPPATCSAGSDTPSCVSTGWPNSAKASTIRVAMATALIEIARRSALVACGVSEAAMTAEIDRADDGEEGGEGGERRFEHVTRRYSISPAPSSIFRPAAECGPHPPSLDRPAIWRQAKV